MHAKLILLVKKFLEIMCILDWDVAYSINSCVKCVSPKVKFQRREKESKGKRRGGEEKRVGRNGKIMQ